MKVAIYSHSIPPTIDGVTRRFMSLMEELIELGHEIVLFTLEEEPKIPFKNKFRMIQRILPIRVYLYPSKEIGFISMKVFWDILRVMRKEKPDVLHVTQEGMTPLFGMAARLCNVPCVLSIHTDVVTALQFMKAPWPTALVFMLKEGIDSICVDSCATTSQSFLKKLRGQGARCDWIMPTAVDVYTFTPDAYDEEIRKELTFGDENAFLAVYVGRISPEKRVHELVPLLQEIDNMYLAIIGDGPDAPKYASMHGRENRIYCKPRFLSHADLAKVYASADVHITASMFETFGNTILEAHACGTPVIVPKSQGFIDTVTHGKDGYFFEGDDVTDALQYLEMLAENEIERERNGKNALKKAMTRKPDLVAKGILGWYESSIAKNRDEAIWIRRIRWFLLFLTFLCHVVFFQVWYQLGFNGSLTVKNGKKQVVDTKHVKKHGGYNGVNGTSKSKEL